MNNGTKVLMVALVLAVLAGVFFMFRASQNGSLTGTVVPTETVMEDTTNPTAMPNVTEGVSPTESDEEGSVKSFTTSAENFSFSLKEMRVKQGDTVRVTLNNSEGMHDWKVDEFSAGTKVLAAGESETVEFVANKKGTFEYYCSVGAHRAQGMVGKLIVE